MSEKPLAIVDRCRQNGPMTTTDTRPAASLLVDSLYDHLDLYRRNAAAAMERIKSCQQQDITGYPLTSAVSSYHEWTASAKALESVVGSAADAEAGR